MSKNITITYRMGLPDGELAVDFRFDPETFMLEPLDDESAAPAWTRLDRNQCPNCTLAEADADGSCPTARAIASILGRIGDRWSTEQVDAAVERDGRAVVMKTDLQTVLGAMFGLIGPTSGCPTLAPLRPMARMHAPFVPLEETVARSAALYLLGRYFAARDGADVDYTLDGLQALYQQVNAVNQSIAHRLRTAEEKDAARNAIALLDARAASADISLDDKLESLRDAFAPMTQLSEAPAPHPN